MHLNKDVFSVILNMSDRLTRLVCRFVCRDWSIIIPKPVIDFTKPTVVYEGYTTLYCDIIYERIQFMELLIRLGQLNLFKYFNKIYKIYPIWMSISNAAKFEKIEFLRYFKDTYSEIFYDDDTQYNIMHHALGWDLVETFKFCDIDTCRHDYTKAPYKIAKYLILKFMNDDSRKNDIINLIKNAITKRNKDLINFMKETLKLSEMHEGYREFLVYKGTSLSLNEYYY